MVQETSENRIAGDKLADSELVELSDKALVQLCKTRGIADQRPFTVLFRRYQDYVWRICYRYVHNREDAEDLMQEVFFKAYRGLPDFKGDSSLKTWLSRISVNASLNKLRHWDRRPQESGESIEELLEFMPQDADAVPNWVQNPKAQIMSQVLKELDSEEIELIQMKDLEELTYQEISQKLGISLSAAKMRVHRARLALRTAYSEKKE